MIKPLTGHATLHVGTEPDPLPSWRASLSKATPEGIVKLLVDISSWAQQHPKSAEAWTLLGDTYLQIKQPYAAEKAFSTVIALDPNIPRAREGLGLSLLHTKQPAKALKHFAQAHILAPENAEILVHWGLALIQTGQLQKAHIRLKQASKLDPENAIAWLNLGVVDIQRGAWESAIAFFQNALARQPDLPAAHQNLALVYRQIGNLDQALAATHELISRHGLAATDWVLRAELLLNAGQLDLAEQALQQATQIDLANPDIYLCQSLLFAARRQYSDAEGVLKTALALSRDDPNIQLELGHLQLLLGRYNTGWELHEARKNLSPSPVRQFPIPEWQGEDLTNKTVLVHAEQGLGDTILFAHCLPDLMQRAGHVVIEAASRLATLLARSFPEATVVARDPQSKEIDWLHQVSPPVDLQIPIGSLPRHFRRSIEQFPMHTGYLRADPARVAYWRERLSHLDLPAVGLAWRGGLLQTGSKQRSFSPVKLQNMLESFPVHWVSLQYGADAVQEAEVAAASGLKLTHWPEALVDQDEAAALTCALNTVVTVCSTQAHLTGALGKPGWVLAPFSPNWRYGAEGVSMPWYPSLKVLRQNIAGDWTTPLTELRQQLVFSTH